MSTWIWLTGIVAGILLPCLALAWWVTRPPKFDRSDKVSPKWITDHTGGRYTDGGGK